MVFRATGNSAEKIAFDELAGRYIVLFFFGSAARPDIAKTLESLGRHNDLFDHKRALLFGVGNDPADFQQDRLHQHSPGQLFGLDADGSVTKHYSLIDPAPKGIPSYGLYTRSRAADPRNRSIR